jgi:hypothetical protein
MVMRRELGSHPESGLPHSLKSTSVSFPRIPVALMYFARSSTTPLSATSARSASSSGGGWIEFYGHPSRRGFRGLRIGQRHRDVAPCATGAAIRIKTLLRAILERLRPVSDLEKLAEEYGIAAIGDADYVTETRETGLVAAPWHQFLRGRPFGRCHPAHHIRGPAQHCVYGAARPALPAATTDFEENQRCKLIRGCFEIAVNGPLSWLDDGVAQPVRDRPKRVAENVVRHALIAQRLCSAGPRQDDQGAGQDQHRKNDGERNSGGTYRPDLPLHPADCRAKAAQYDAGVWAGTTSGATWSRVLVAVHTRCPSAQGNAS